MRINKKISLVLFSLCSIQAYPMGNPAAIYCEQMGYEYVMETNEQGESLEFCVMPDGTKVNAMDFFKGKVKPEYSYCQKYGYDIVPVKEKVGDATIESAYCVKGNQLRRSEDSAPEGGVKMLDLMRKNNEFWTESDADTTAHIGKAPDEEASELRASTSLPTTFDARNLGIVNDVRNQGSLGTCWAFATAACSEISYNKISGSTNSNRKKVSESFIVWCLGGSTAVVNKHGTLYNQCPTYDEGWMANAMSAVAENGVCLLEYYPYTTTKPGKCDHWNDPKIYPGKHNSVSYGNINALKEAIYKTGCVGVNMDVRDAFHSYSNGVFDMSKDTKGNAGGHSVTLIGWGKTSSGEEYWILRNSWGSTWGENGYMKLKMSTAKFWQGDYMNPGDYIYKGASISENINVPADGNVTFIGGNKVLLTKGFKVSQGGKFKAKYETSSSIAATSVVIKCGSSGTSKKSSSDNIAEEEEESSETKVLLYPNPTTGEFTISFKGEEGEKVITISDISGKIVYSTHVDTDSALIDMNGFASGIYYVRVTTESHAESLQVILK